MPVSALTRTANDIVAEALMTRSALSGAIVLVEGPSDSRFITRYLRSDSVEVIICGGKTTVLTAMNQMARLPLTGYLAIVDRDFDDHRGIAAVRDVFYTDTHDIETLLLSKRLNTIVAELGAREKIKNYERITSKSVADSLLERGAAFSRMRFLNDVRPGLNTQMDAFSPWKYMDIATWALDEPRLQSEFARACGHSMGALLALVALLPSLNNWRDVQGHDSLAILSIGLRQVLGNGNQVSEVHLASALRLAFSEADFASTDLYAQLKGWQDSTGLPLLGC